MFSLFGALWAKDKVDEVSAYASRVKTTIDTRVVTPLYHQANRAANTVHDWAIPVPPPTETDAIGWKRVDSFTPFINNDSIELYALFEDSTKRAQINQKHVFCALHHPGLALDLCVLFNIPVDDDHKKYILNHYVYSDWKGSPRDRLLDNLERSMNRFNFPVPDKNYEDFIRHTLYQRESLLYQVLADHRYAYSPAALRGRPDTLTQLNQLLREKTASRIHATKKY